MRRAWWESLAGGDKFRDPSPQYLSYSNEARWQCAVAITCQFGRYGAGWNGNRHLWVCLRRSSSRASKGELRGGLTSVRGRSDGCITTDVASLGEQPPKRPHSVGRRPAVTNGWSRHARVEKGGEEALDYSEERNISNGPNWLRVIFRVRSFPDMEPCSRFCVDSVASRE